MKSHASIVAVSVAMFIPLSLCLAGPRIFIESTDVKAGRIYNDQKLEHAFTVENRGDATLVIDRIYGCGGPCRSYVLATNEVPPGGSAKLSFAFDMYLVEGDEIRVRTVHSNDPQTPDVPLTFNSTVIPRYALDPKIVFFQMEDTNETASAVVRIRSGSPSGNPLQFVSSSTNVLEGTLSPARAGEGMDLTVRMVPPLQEGIVRGEVVVRTSVTGDPPCRVRVSAYVKPRFAVLPGKLVFQPVDELQERIVFVRQKRGGNVALTGVELPEDMSIRCEVNPGPGEGDYRIYVKASGLAGKRGVQGEMVIRTDDPARPGIQIPIEAGSLILQ